MPKLTEIIEAVRNESGAAAGECPLCFSTAFDDDSGICEDCGTDILKDWQLGANPTVG